MARDESALIREGLLTRRRKLEQAMASSAGGRGLEDLLEDVLNAPERLDKGTFGLCDVCHEPIETARLAADPFVRVCLDHLNPDQQLALEDDLSVASQIQNGLLPEQDIRVMGWETAYHYEAIGQVSGDYCDLLSDGGSLYFMVGDVSGKGVSAAMLMTHLHATFRAHVSQSLPIERVMEQASRMFCESTLPTYFATLALGKADAGGEIDLCIAGHLPLLITQAPNVKRIHATGLPLGMFYDERFSVIKARLAPGDSVVLYTDGLSESLDPSGAEYGIDRLVDIVGTTGYLSPQEMITTCLVDLESFRSGSVGSDDLTLMVVTRSVTAAKKVAQS